MVSLARGRERKLRWSIGEVAEASGLSLKALRLYDTKGLLRPTTVDANSRRRYYDANAMSLAVVIASLRKLDIGLSSIGEILATRFAAADLRRIVADLSERARFDSQRAKLRQDHLDSMAVLVSEPPDSIDWRPTLLRLPARATISHRCIASLSTVPRVAWSIGMRAGLATAYPWMILHSGPDDEGRRDFEMGLCLRHVPPQLSGEVSEIPGGEFMVAETKGDQVDEAAHRLRTTAATYQRRAVGACRIVARHRPLFEWSPHRMAVVLQIRVVPETESPPQGR